MKHLALSARTLVLGSLALLASGCATTEGPYRAGPPGYPYPYPGPSEPIIIHSPGVQPVYPVYPAPDWRQSQRERERWERDRERWDRDQRERAARERDARARDQRERDARERLQREQEARREQEMRERERRERERQNANRRDYDRYNPRSGQWMPRSEDMP